MCCVSDMLCVICCVCDMCVVCLMYCSCVVIDCAGLTVVNSGTADASGVTGATVTVTCNDGYVGSTSNSNSFTATCSAHQTDGGISEWTGVETCNGMLSLMCVVEGCNV